MRPFRIILIDDEQSSTTTFAPLGRAPDAGSIVELPPRGASETRPAPPSATTTDCPSRRPDSRPLRLPTCHARPAPRPSAAPDAPTRSATAPSDSGSRNTSSRPATAGAATSRPTSATAATRRSPTRRASDDANAHRWACTNDTTGGRPCSTSAPACAAASCSWTIELGLSALGARLGVPPASVTRSTTPHAPPTVPPDGPGSGARPAARRSAETERRPVLLGPLSRSRSPSDPDGGQTTYPEVTDELPL